MDLALLSFLNRVCFFFLFSNIFLGVMSLGQQDLDAVILACYLFDVPSLICTFVVPQN
jgi:hypothetical protein